jgi:hypothetical protein
MDGLRLEYLREEKGEQRWSSSSLLRKKGTLIQNITI